MSSIVAAVDFSDVTDAVIDAAIKHARASGSELVIAHAVEPDVGFSMGEAGADIPPNVMAELLDSRRRQLRELADRIGDVTVKPVLIQGDIVRGILDESRDAELIVVGSHGHGRLYELLVGSVASGIIRHAPCPVLVVPTEKR